MSITQLVSDVILHNDFLNSFTDLNNVQNIAHKFLSMDINHSILVILYYYLLQNQGW